MGGPSSSGGGAGGNSKRGPSPTQPAAAGGDPNKRPRASADGATAATPASTAATTAAAPTTTATTTGTGAIRVRLPNALPSSGPQQQQPQQQQQPPPQPPPPPPPPPQVDDAELEADLAAAVGLDPVNLCDAEEEFLPPLPDGFNEAAYCRVRNHVLALWRLDVTRYLPAAEAPTGAIRTKYAPYAMMAWRFLNDHGYINFGLVRPGGAGGAEALAAAAAERQQRQFGGGRGVLAGSNKASYHQPPHPPPPAAGPLPDAQERRRTVIVIGAGLAGLACARQLRAAGLRVVVLEARSRLGGRVHSKRLEVDLPPGHPSVAKGGPTKAVGIADLGGSIITGLDGNPLAVLARQVGLPLHDIDGSDVPLHLEGAGGAEPDRDLDEGVHAAFNAIVDRATELREELPWAAGELLSMQAALDGLLARRQGDRERRAARARRERRRRLEERRAWTRERRQQEQQQAEAGANGNGAAAAAATTTITIDDSNLASPNQTASAPPLPGAATATTTPSDPAADVERLLFQWHMANVEFASAQRLPALSAKHWDIDDAHEFLGAHCFPPGGGLRLVASLAEGLPVMYRCPATLIRYSKREGVVVHTSTAGAMAADAVVVTVPLGVLKVGEREPGALRFDPPLPSRKRQAIERLGFGVLNKCMLLFPHCFWGGRDMFGHVPSDPARRGEYYLFYSYDQVSGGALLGALVAGDAAVDFERRPAPEAVARVMAVLRAIFTPLGVDVPPPLMSACTRWQADPWARGSYSSVAPGGLGPQDYDALAEPVGDRVFFAGEATTHKWPATMHGAFLSGLREAARVKRALLGGGGAGEDAAGGGELSPVAAAKPAAAANGGDHDPATAAKARAAAAAAIQATLPPTAQRAVEQTCRDAERLAALFGLGEGAFGTGGGGGGGAAAPRSQPPPEPDLQFGCFSAFFGPRFTEFQDDAIVAVDTSAVLGGEGGPGDGAGAGEVVAAGAGAAAAGGTGAGATGKPSAAAGRAGGPVLVHALLTRRQLLALQDVDGGDEVRLALLAVEMGVRLFGRSSGLTSRARRVLAAVAAARLPAEYFAHEQGA
jgi:lysine-specific histone demethylase 1